MRIGKDYYSAGNPYLEADRRVITAKGERQFTDFLSSSLGYRYERTSVSNVFSGDAEAMQDIDTTTADSLLVQDEGPTNNNYIDAGVEYSFGSNKPSIRADYEIKFQNRDDLGKFDKDDTTAVIDSVTSDTTFTITTVTKYAEFDYGRVDNSLGIELKQRFKNGMDYSIKYKLIRKNDYSVYPDADEIDDEDSWENTVTSRFTFRVKRRIRNKTTVKVKFKTEIDEEMERLDYKISDNLRVNIIPRKLTLNLKGEYRNQNEATLEFPNGIDLIQKVIEADLKYAITSRLSAKIMGKYEDYSDATESSSENYTMKIGGLHLTYLF